ncbi:MAG: hypothetical protein U0941_24475 [Planctomycetaceae bacterium]
MPRSTILLALFSPDDITSATLDSLAQSLQDGLDAMSGEAPDVHCLYRRFSTPDPGSARQFRLFKGTPLVVNSGTSHPSDTIKNQLIQFFSSTPVRRSLSHDSVVYLIIGAHGSPDATQTGVVLGNSDVDSRSAGLQSRSPEQPFNKSATFRRPFHPLNPVGVAFFANRTSLSKSITITELNEAVQFLDRPPQTLVLHCCFLSSIEVIYELRQIRHHIACESQLKNILFVSNWFFDMATGAEPEKIKVFDHLGLDNTEGIFSSHRTSAKNVNDNCAPAYINGLNQLGEELLKHLRDGRVNEIETALEDSRVDGEAIVDLWQFCESLSGVCDADVLKTMKRAIDEIQISHALTSVDPAIVHYRGISVCICRDDAKHGPKQLPAAFSRAARDWIEFLVNWHNRSTPTA